MKILAVIGARPQFIKHAPIELEFRGKADIISVHTGQHYDANMSGVFFDQLGLKTPAYNLEVGSHAHGKQTALMIMKLEPILETEKPDALLTYGDTNSTLAGALVAAKLHVPVIHIEAGLRSFNREMPEEINRLVTDHLSTLLFAPTPLAVRQLEHEGITEGVFLSGDVMYDMMQIAMKKHIVGRQDNFGQYHLTTIHRPYNTDNEDRLREILETLDALDEPVWFPMHPRTLNLARKFSIDLDRYHNLNILKPAGYFEMLTLIFNAKTVITDSGGIQKEAYWMQKPCITLRSETEWVETLENQWNTLVFENLEEIATRIHRVPGKHKASLYASELGSQGIVERILYEINS